ncbi:MAG: winged helix-turn-helix domain-containing protein [Candidatus Norongarragalinales archaeon]
MCCSLEEKEKITLEKNAFKALASETRVSILKKLGARRATPSELAASLGISAQAASEHLARLERAGLVRREDEGRKWVYYSLTDKGKALVSPSESRKIWVLLSLGFLAFTVAGFSHFFLQPAAQLGAASGALGVAPPAFSEKSLAVAGEPLKAVASPSLLVEAAAHAAGGVSGACANCGFGATFFEIVLVAVGCLLIAGAVYCHVKSKKRFHASA